MEVDVRCNAIRENETFGILSLALFDRIPATGAADESRVVKLVPASRGSPGSEYGSRVRADLAIAEVDETFSHFDLDGNNAGHPDSVDRLREIHQASAFGIKLFAGLDEPANRREHSAVGCKFVPIELGIAAADVQDISFGDLSI